MSPDAATASYLRERISVSASSDVSATVTFTLHPLACSNGVTQSTFGSVEPFSTYPARATSSSVPSPSPSCSSAAIFGGPSAFFSGFFSSPPVHPDAATISAVEAASNVQHFR